MIPLVAAHLLQSTYFASAAGLLTLAFRRNGAHVRYWLWLSASLKFLIPFAPLVDLGSHLRWASAAQRITARLAAPAASWTMEQFSRPTFAGALQPAPAAPGQIHWIPAAVAGTWLCGFLSIALSRFRSWLLISAAVRTSSLVDIAAPVEVRVSPGPSSGLLEPGVVGGIFGLRPVVLLPEGFAERLTPSELKAILAHELCHVRRRDNLFAAIHMIVEAVFWFYPLVWWIGSRLVEERERACDEEVLSLGNPPDVYADAILNVCRLYVGAPLLCVSGVTGAGIVRRIETIMINPGPQRLNGAKKLLLAGAGIAALAAPVVVGLAVGVSDALATRAGSPAAQMTQAVPATVPTPLAAEPEAQAHIANAQTTPPPTGRPRPPLPVAHAPQPPPILAQTILAQAPPQQAAASGAPRPPADSAASLEFEAASVKPFDASRGFFPGIKGGPGTSDPERISFTSSLKGFLMAAYGVGSDYIAGPGWLDASPPQFYAIEATIRPGATKEQASRMLQNLLTQRFQLTMHRETRDVPLFELTVAGKGPRLREYLAGSYAANGRGFTEGLTHQNASDGINHAVANKVSIAQLISFLSFQLKRPVVDKTGLTGLYNYNLDFMPVLPGTGEDVSTASAPDLITAVQVQLGMKLTAKKGPLEIIVIDHAEKTPVEN